MCEWLYKLIEPAVLIQIVIAVGLGVYAWDTRKLRKSAQEQNEIMQKPCLVPVTKRRGQASIEQDILKDRQYPNERVLDPDVPGDVQLRNIGNGPAFNVRYEAQLQKQNGCLTGALPYIPKEGTESIFLGASISNARGNVKLKLSYESLSGRSYESEMSIKEWDAVVSDWIFR